MSDSDNSRHQDDSDEDIYKDIPEFNFEDELAKLEGYKETYKQEANDLSEKVKLLSEENKELKKLNEVLKKNLSTLLKTAQAEVKRKDCMIQELRTQVESFTLRRNKNVTKDKYTSTDDFDFSSKAKCEPEKYKNGGDIKISKSYENQTSSEGERRSNQEEEKWKEVLSGKEENANCDIDRNSGYYRKDSKSNFRHSDSSHDWHKGKKSSRYEDSSDYRRSYRKDHRVHSKSDSFDKKRHSRSSDSRFLSRRRYSRERRSDHRRHNNSERRRSDESSERPRRRKERSRSREKSWDSKESSPEKAKTISSRDKDSTVRIKEQISSKSEISDRGKGSEIADNKKARADNSERRTVHEDAPGKNKQSKEKRSQKYSLDIFSTKSPLDALYNEMINSRHSNRYSSTKLGIIQPESDIEGELSVTQAKNEQFDTSESQADEDWTLSFKNERPNNTKPMTLYSRRMMRKFSSELKGTLNPKEKEEPRKRDESENLEENKKSEKIEEVEKEPGELTDDENIIESSKEFQELAKAASIEIELNEKTAKEKASKEPNRRDSLLLENARAEPKKIQKEMEKTSLGGEDPSAYKEIEPDKETREVIECSPFKNNYKLIEISPIKPSGSGSERILDFYNQKAPAVQPLGQAALDSSDAGTELEKGKLSNTSEETNAEIPMKILNSPLSRTRKENEKESGGREGKELRKKKGKTEGKKSEDSKKKENLGRGKRRAVSWEETEKSTTNGKNLKRKRKSSEPDERDSESKKPKVEKSESHQKRSRSKPKSKTEHEEPKPQSEITERDMAEEIKEDISSFEFFKPATKTEIPQAPGESDKCVCTTTDYKMTATMSVTGVVRLETPDKCMERLKNLMINEHMIFNVLDSKTNSQFSPLIGSKCIEMTPRKMLKNDLMLTDSEDDSVCKQNTGRGGDQETEEKVREEEQADETSGSENSECDSDSGASDFVDLL